VPAPGHGGHDTIELIAALVIVIGGVIFTALSLRTRPSHPGLAASVDSGAFDAPTDAAAGAADGAMPSVRRSLVLILAGLSGGAAVIHLAAAPNHYDELGDIAAGFLISAAFQALWVRWCLAGPSRATMAIGIAGNLAIVAAWAWTRTVGLPMGPFAGSAEPIGFPDAASVAFELLLVGGLVARWLDLDLALARRGAARTIASIAVVPVLGLVIVLTSLATVAIAEGLDHGGPSAHPPVEHIAAP